MLNNRLHSAAPVELAGWLMGRLPPGERVLVDAPKTDLAALQLSMQGLAAVDLKEHMSTRLPHERRAAKEAF